MGAACSLTTSIPDLTSGTGDVGADADAGAIDAPEAGDTSQGCTHFFTYDPKGRALKVVHVAGTFNGWPKTLAGGGWQLTNTGGIGGLWTGTHAIAPGHYAYKFVLDESQFVPDPGNPNTEPDGFGSVNSLLDVACGE
jgi:hypothetical protein